MSKANTSQPSLRGRNVEQLELRTVLSGAAIVQPFSNVEYFGDGRKDWSANSIQAPEVWAQGHTGEDIVIAVIDTGVDVTHEDLVHNIWVNDGEIPGNDIDDDKNGFVDDVHGWDFIDRDADVSDPSGHGTAVAGIMVASRNDEGVTGVAYDAQIMVIRVLAEDGVGSQIDISAGIRYAVANGADIINMSLGGSHSKRVSTAIEYAKNESVLVVAASGNASLDVPDYPARYSAEFGNVISVGAYDPEMELTSFSNTVGSTGTVQVDAPGYRVYTTSLENTYRFFSGTSMAAPHVSAVAALALSANNDLPADSLRDMITDGATQEVWFSDSIGGLNAATTVAFAAASAPPEQEAAAIVEPPSDELEKPALDPVADALTEEVLAQLPGDVDGNGQVDFNDFLSLSRNFGSTNADPKQGDLDGDGDVDFNDFLTFSRNYGRSIDELLAQADVELTDAMSAELLDDLS